MKSHSSPPERENAVLAVAWAYGEVTMTQVTKALGRDGNSYAHVARGLRDAVRLGLIVRTASARALPEAGKC